MSEREPDCTVRAMRRDDGRIAVVAGNHTIEAAGRTSLDPKAPAPSALDYLVAALAADLLSGLGREAARDGLRIDDAELLLAARLDNPLVALGVEGEAGTAGLAAVTGTLYVATGASFDALLAAWNRALARAPVYSTLGRCAVLRIELRPVP